MRRAEKRLADGVVDLVAPVWLRSSRLIVDLGSAEPLGPTLGVINGARATDVVLELVLEFGDEILVLAAGLVGASELIERVHQRLGDEYPAIPAEMPLLVRKLNHLHALPLPTKKKSRDFRRVLDSLGRLDAARNVDGVGPGVAYGAGDVVRQSGRPKG